jgi:hypothetical protein
MNIKTLPRVAPIDELSGPPADSLPSIHWLVSDQVLTIAQEVTEWQRERQSRRR